MIFVGIYIIVTVVLLVAMLISFAIDMLMDFPSWNKFKLVWGLFFGWFVLGILVAGIAIGVSAIQSA